MLAGRADIGVASVSPHHDPRLIVEPLSPLRVYLACRPNHPLADRRPVTLEDAMRFPLVAAVLTGAQAALASRAAQAAGHKQDDAFVPPITVNSQAAARLLAIHSDAITPATAAYLLDDVAAGRLVVLPVEAPEMRTAYCIVRLADRSPGPAELAFIAALKKVEKEHRALESQFSPGAGTRRAAAASRCAPPPDRRR